MKRVDFLAAPVETAADMQSVPAAASFGPDAFAASLVEYEIMETSR
ncbi:MAG: hypothetical protein ABFD98_00035 [Syntrophobacteraceae bacterium]|nr:hypothetical protein [Desulfobacteraceae bacterium]